MLTIRALYAICELFDMDMFDYISNIIEFLVILPIHIVIALLAFIFDIIFLPLEYLIYRIRKARELKQGNEYDISYFLDECIEMFD